MTKIRFQKYQATGNDFVVVEAAQLPDHTDFAKLAQKICPRRRGIGSDGLIVIDRDCKQDFTMLYYNSDGSGPIMCGNGARASVQYVHQNLLQKNIYEFQAPDGIHLGRVQDEEVEITMSEADSIASIDVDGKEAYLLDTGAPHIVLEQELSAATDLKNIARSWRYEYDANVNYIYNGGQNWHIRTYERGVEDETLACGTGVTAAALVLVKKIGAEFPVRLKAQGGLLKVDRVDQKLWLRGAALQVFQGEIEI